MPEQPLEPELKYLERSLSALEPAAQLARDQLFFRAGKAAAGRRWAWPATTAVSTLAAVLLGLLLWRQSGLEPDREVQIRVVEKIVLVPATPAAPVDAPLVIEPQLDTSAQDYLRLRQGVVRWGADVLHSPPPQTTTEESLTPADVPRLSPSQAGRTGFFQFIPLSSGGGS